MLAVLITARQEEEGEELARRLKESIDEQKKEIKLIGPAKASIGKLNDLFRFVIYCKSSDYQVLIEIKDSMEALIQTMERRNETVQFDFDPMDSY